MTAATKDRDTQRVEGTVRGFPVKGAALLYAGVMAIVSGGFLTKGITVAGKVCVGVTRARIDNSAGADGDIQGETYRGVFGPFANSAAGDQITLAEVGADCYIVDDSTVAKTDGSGTRTKAGKVWNVTTDGVWVDFA